jgi:hypothetical protein
MIRAMMTVERSDIATATNPRLFSPACLLKLNWPRDIFILPMAFSSIYRYFNYTDAMVAAVVAVAVVAVVAEAEAEAEAEAAAAAVARSQFCQPSFVSHSLSRSTLASFSPGL